MENIIDDEEEVIAFLDLWTSLFRIYNVSHIREASIASSGS